MSVTINGTTGVTTNNSVYTDASGNTGIGTSSPTVKLQVSGAMAIQGPVGYPTSGSGWEIYNFDATTNAIQSYNRTSSLWMTANYNALSHVYSTSGSERMRIDSSGYMTNTVNGNGAGLIQGQQYYRLNAAVAGANATGAQSIFGVGVTLSASTVYEFEAMIYLNRTAGTTSHTISLGFAGTATINNIQYQGYATFSPAAAVTSADSFFASTTASAFVATAATVSGTAAYFGLIKGTVSINAGGTFIPQYTLSAAPGGAYSTQIGSYIKISALSASGANTSIGTWA
jgi:hypothetical protein